MMAASYWLGPLLNNLGWELYEAGKLDAALDTFERALEAREQEPENQAAIEIARYAVGKTLRAQVDPDWRSRISSVRWRGRSNVGVAMAGSTRSWRRSMHPSAVSTRPRRSGSPRAAAPRRSGPGFRRGPRACSPATRSRTCRCLRQSSIAHHRRRPGGGAGSTWRRTDGDAKPSAGVPPHVTVLFRSPRSRPRGRAPRRAARALRRAPALRRSSSAATPRVLLSRIRSPNPDPFRRLTEAVLRRRTPHPRMSPTRERSPRSFRTYRRSDAECGRGGRRRTPVAPDRRRSSRGAPCRKSSRTPHVAHPSITASVGPCSSAGAGCGRAC